MTPFIFSLDSKPARPSSEHTLPVKALSCIWHRMNMFGFRIEFLTKCQLIDQIDAVYKRKEYTEVIYLTMHIRYYKYIC